MVGVPALSYLIAGLLAWGDVKTDLRLLQQVQDTNTRSVASHATASGHSGTQNRLGRIDTKQAVMESTLKNIDKQMQTQGATLNDINRHLQNLNRNAR